MLDSQCQLSNKGRSGAFGLTSEKIKCLMLRRKQCELHVAVVYRCEFLPMFSLSLLLTNSGPIVMVCWVGAGLVVVDGMHAEQSQGFCRMSGVPEHFQSVR